MRTLRVVLVAAVLVLVPAAPAHAAPLGALTLTPAGGTVDAVPMLTGAATSAPCPAGYGTNATLKVGRVGGPYNNLNKSQSANTYDQAPFALAANRSMATAVGAGLADGVYEVAVVCTGEVLGDHADLFLARITVTGRAWVYTPGGTSPVPAPAPNATGSAGRLDAQVAPGPVASASKSPAASGPLPRTGTPVGTIVAVGALLLAAGTGLWWLARRRRA